MNGPLQGQEVVSATIGVNYPTLQIDVEFTAMRGDVIGLVGPNGSGKTTILRTIAGLRPLDQGRIVINGVTVDEPAADVLIDPQQRNVGVVFQDYRLFPNLSALDNVAFGLQCRGHKRSAARATASEWLDRLDLSSHRNHKPSTLSGGQAQRIALARALAIEPDLLLLDEPLAAIDRNSRSAIRNDLRRYLQAFGGVAIVVSHQLDDVRVLANRVISVDAGRITQTGLSEVMKIPPTAGSSLT